MLKTICTIFCLSSSLAFGFWQQETIDQIKVNLYIPHKKSTQLTSLSPLMVNLHGCAQTADDLKNNGNWETVADEYNMIVAIPFVPNGGKYAGCWDYYGANHTRTNRDNSYIINMVQNLLNRTELNLDPAQVYVSGLSSGAGEALVLGCLAPDIFAGIGLNAGPTIGTGPYEIGTPPSELNIHIEVCKNLAASNNVEQHFQTQLTSIVYGNNDYIVNTSHNLTNAQLMGTIYKVKNQSTFDTNTLEGASSAGAGTLYSDLSGPRVSVIMNTNLGHNWPAGQGGYGGSYINKNSINYPRYLTKFFIENNRRTKWLYK